MPAIKDAKSQTAHPILLADPWYKLALSRLTLVELFTGLGLARVIKVMLREVRLCVFGGRLFCFAGVAQLDAMLATCILPARLRARTGDGRRSGLVGRAIGIGGHVGFVAIATRLVVTLHSESLMRTR